MVESAFSGNAFSKIGGEGKKGKKLWCNCIYIYYIRHRIIIIIIIIIIKNFERDKEREREREDLLFIIKKFEK